MQKLGWGDFGGGTVRWVTDRDGDSGERRLGSGAVA